MPSIPCANVHAYWTHGLRYAGCCLLITTWRGLGQHRSLDWESEPYSWQAVDNTRKHTKSKVWRNWLFAGYVPMTLLMDIRPLFVLFFGTSHASDHHWYVLAIFLFFAFARVFSLVEIFSASHSVMRLSPHFTPSLMIIIIIWSPANCSNKIIIRWANESYEQSASKSS